MTDTRPRVALLLTGGTIGSGGHDENDRLDYVDLARVLSDDEALPLYRFPEHIEVVPQRFTRMRSNDVDLAVWRRLRDEILRIEREEPDTAGIVIAHGTATLEETAYFLQLTVPTTLPVVLVGAQRPPTALGSDAQTNLQAAICLAASPAARGHGVLVAMDDRILCARDVTKASNHALDAFEARVYGPLGEIDAYGNVWMYRKDLRAHTTTSAFAHLLDDPEVQLAPTEIVPMWAGATPRLLERALSDGAAGVVLAALPPSMSPQAVEDAVDAAVAAGVVVVQSSRAAGGRVHHRRDFDRRGLVSSDSLSPQAARVLLSLCLTAGYTIDQTRDAFASH
ncbi:asparaginase [Microbacterium sp. zg.Y625]|uniref:asparaginase n=1 Tax=Microbacterium jiangjiandongii TaxID=3049071 RepID=UPI00214BA91E|nr:MULTISPECIES: asparaginase [unclassified Microbacterium]MCR2791743.1 asparaginase [Microbacterium sp. zg.Y625]WIM24560.1 asparaginase [Microbacterium sp. zg-Y625]